MLTECTCGTNVEAKLDIEKNVVVCTNCYKEIELNDFTKTMMRQRGDILEKKKVTIPPNGLQYTCDNQKCSKTFSAEVNRKDNKVHCSYCGFICKVSDITIERLKEAGVYDGYTDSYFKDEGESQEVSEKELTKTLETEILSAPSVDAPKKGRGRPRKSPVN